MAKMRLSVRVAACAIVAGLGALAAFGATRVGVINWDCSPPSDTWFGGYQTRSLSPARYRYLTPYYADVNGPDEISYHRRTPAEYDRELQYAIDAGIDYFAYCWYGEDPYAKRVPLHSGRSISCEDHLWEITWARQFHRKSPLREKIGLCAIVLGYHVYTDEEVTHLAEAMREPCYEKVAGGRPLLYIFGDVTKGEILARIRRAAQTAGVAEPFVVAMHGTRKSLPVTGDRSVQARSAYAPPAPPKGGAFLRYPDMYAAIRRANAAWIDQGFDIVPAFATGRDHWPRIEHQVPWTDNSPMRYASPATERELVECAKDFKAFMDANRAKCPLDHVLTYAWNEFEEGAYICPLWAPNGGADVSRLKAFAKVARVFKGEQGVTAVPDDPLPDLADLRKRLPEIFKDCKDSARHEWFATRLEAAERLAALPSRTLVMQAELDEFRVSFRDALAHWANDPLNPAVKPVEINARDFGVKGDGTTDDAPAFARAVDAVRKLGGRPSVLRIPAGQFLLGTAKKTAPGITAHLDLTSLTNCAVIGDSPETTRFEFGVYGHTGVVLCNSVNTTLARADFSWREAPFSQTVLESYEPSNCTAIVRQHPGTLRPDDPRYAKAKNAQVCGLFTADGKALHNRGAVPFFDRHADDLGGGRYRIYFDANRRSMAKFKPLPGDVIVLPDRDNTIQGISTRGSSFCNLVHIWFRNARASTISGAGAHYVTADHCRTFPKSPDLVFSSNADTFYNARGSHLAHCEFWGMNDDGANSLGNGTGILSREGARTVVIYARKGGRVRVGDVLQILHPMEGRFAGDFRIAALRAFKAKNGGKRWAITFDRDLPADLVTCTEAGQIDNATRYAISHGLGKVKKAPDLLFFPLEYGTGFTMIDNKIHDLRGCGLNVQCPHTIIDGNVFKNISLGMKITALTQWYEGTPPCNVVVRNNVFRDCNTGIAAHFTTINGAISKERPIRWLEIVSNRLENVVRPFALNNVSDEIVRDNEIVNRPRGGSGVAASATLSTGELFEGFMSPPKENYPSMWVFNLGAKTSREVITYDLEQFAKVGVSSFTIYGTRMTASNPYGGTSLKGNLAGVLCDRLRWTLHEAHRLNLGVWMMLGPAGCGNDKCPPEHAQKDLVLTTARASADADGLCRVTLPKKGAKETPRNADGSPKYYWDVATLAVPVKDGFVQTNEVIDVSAHLDRASDTLSWKAPHVGEWRFIRAGAVPKIFGWCGCYIDHMSRAAFDAHWAQVAQPLLDAITPDERAALKGVFCDSWEAGTINWTWDFAEEFKRRRGYDFLSMLPAKVGVKMVGPGCVEQFQRDWNVTVGELIAENHYAYQKEVANKHGLLSSAEACGPHLHHGDVRTMQGRCDVAMGEFWMPSPHRPEDSQRFMLRDSATAAHVYGMDVVESEAFTTMGTHWEESPAMFKPCADRAFCDGLTRVCYHGMLMSISPDALPGDTRRAGAYYSPKGTWWKYSAPMNTYFARCSWMLSRGRFAADCLLYAGDAIDLFIGMKRPGDGLGVGYDYDLCPTELLLRARVENGEIVLPSGMRYKTLFLSDINPARARMAPGRLRPIKEPLPPVVHPIPPEAARKLAQLERDGATILRTRADMKRFLDADALPPDFMVEEEAVRPGIDWIHRTDRDFDIYFVSNQRGTATRFTAAFRQKSCQVELWDAVTGTRTPAPCEPTTGGRRVRLNLELAAGGSVFVVFLTSGALGERALPAGGAQLVATATLTGPWSVTFDPKWGGPTSSITFPTLTDWTQHADPGIRYYSGTAVYRKTFDAPPNCPTNSPVTIDLGDLRDVAHVTLNGQPLGVAWTSPYAVTAPSLKATGNVLEIAVVNLWANRLIRDAALSPAERLTNTCTSANPFKKDHPLLPSGLYGPVSIRWP